MKDLLGKRIVAAALGAVVSLSATAWAVGYRGGMEHDPGRMMSYMAEQLELNDTQRQQVQDIATNARAQSAADRARLQELRAELKNMRNDFDAGAAQKMADEIGEITSRMVFQFSSAYAEFYSLLTPEQRAEVDQLQEERGERRSKRWHKRLGEDDQG